MMSASAMPSVCSGSDRTRPRSSPAPTVMKNRPRSRPLKGSIVTSTSRRNSVSASSNPAMKAPSAIDMPTLAAASPAPITTSRQAATNNSVERAAAT